jgi:hypothetical protein
MDDSLNLPVDAQAIARGVGRALDRLGWRSLVEFPLASGRRADLIALDEAGRFLIVEIKSSAADFRADRKWRDYLDYCDFFTFAVAAEFPMTLIPPEVGLMVADAYDAVTWRPLFASPTMAPARRRQLLIRFGRASAERLRRVNDPGV